MELAKQFGLDPTLLAAQIVNFLIILYLLKRFAYKPILAQLDAREKVIKEGLAKAEEARIMLEKAKEDERKMLKEAQDETRKFLDLARDQAAQMLKDAEENAKKRTEQMILDAKEQIVSETKEAEVRLQTEASSLAIMFLEKSLGGMFSDEEQQLVLEKAIQRMKKVKN